MAERGRPTDYKPEYAEQAAKLCALGATDMDLADFFESDPTEDDWLAICLRLIREDRNGVRATRLKRRASERAKSMTPSKRLQNAMRARLWAAIKGRVDGSLFGRLGYSLEELCDHLERQFAAGMTWSNYGRWHVDHKKPCAAFDHSDPEQVKECWSLGNLQPLWAAENVKKGASYAGA